MANNRCTYQQIYTVSIPKKKLLEYVICDEELGKKDLRVFLMLLTELEGYTPPSFDSKREDPLNFKKIDSEWMCDVLDMDESDVRKSIKKLESHGIIERGNTTSVKNGYRFTF